MPPLGTATSALSDLHSRLGDARVAGGLDATAACNPSRLRCSFHYTAVHTYTNARHAPPRPSRKQGLPPPPPSRLCIPRRLSSRPFRYPGVRRQPQLRPGPRARAHTCAQLHGQRIRRHSYPHGACPAPAPAAHSAPADLAIGDTPQPHTPYRPSPPPAAA